MIAIFGSGFGLYGYLPALIYGCNRNILLPAKYKKKFFARTELQRFEGYVKWVNNEFEALEYADGVVLAMRPNDQYDLIYKCLKIGNVKRLLLEKPLAASPQLAKDLLYELNSSDKFFRIGYTFRYAVWSQKLANILKNSHSNGHILFRWSFFAHHFANNLHNWKRSHSAGGGVIRFYGVHLIAFLAELGYARVVISKTYGSTIDEIEKWNAIFAGINLPTCEIIIDTRSNKKEFLVEYKHNSLVNTVINQSDPFEHEMYQNDLNDVDQRVPVITKLCNSFLNDKSKSLNWYDITNTIWMEVESRNEFLTSKF